MDALEEIKVLPPGPGTCRICATAHAPTDPHDRDSLYYQNRFRRKYRRFPTWGDAMAHCNAMTKALWKARLIERGVSPDEFNDDEQRMD